VLLDLLKHDPQTRHLPVHVISGASEVASVIEMGAFGATAKPADRDELARVFRNLHQHVSRAERRVLVAGGDRRVRKAIGDALAEPGVEIETAASIAKAAEQQELSRFDAVVLASVAPKVVQAEITALEAHAGANSPLVAIHGGDADAARIAAHRLAATHAVFATRDLEDLSVGLRSVLRRARSHAPIENAVQPRGAPELAGAKILIVDDDIRNIYSLTSVLESYDVEVLHAERGADGILLLEQTPHVDIALIDIMMPEMDGYETMREIRKRPALADVPLVAVTAKAMKGDRQKCLDAGASDYIAKPVDIDLLLALLRVWIGRSRERMILSAIPLAQSAAE
jgi:CheY-like chemotaxis protein